MKLSMLEEKEMPLVSTLKISKDLFQLESVNVQSLIGNVMSALPVLKIKERKELALVFPNKVTLLIIILLMFAAVITTLLKAIEKLLATNVMVALIMLPLRYPAPCLAS